MIYNHNFWYMLSFILDNIKKQRAQMIMYILFAIKDMLSILKKIH